MNSEELKSGIPVLTASNFIEWRFKMKSFLRGQDLFDRVSGEMSVSRNEFGRFKSADKGWVNRALSIISSKIHSSLISTVTINGGEDDPIILWQNCLEYGSSKKNSNVFSAFRRLSNTTIDEKDIAGSILKVRDAIAELKSLEIDLNDLQLGHQLLDKIPPSLANVQDSILSTGQSDTPITSELVLSMLDNKAKINHSNASIVSSINNLKLKSEPEPFNDSAQALFHACLNGRHNPKANHSASRCFQLHPELQMRAPKNFKEPEASAHFAFCNSDAHEAL